MARGGANRGERRGGRQKGTPNKRTALARAITIATLDNAHISPLELNLALMRNPALPLDDRVKAALEALPFVHARLRRRSIAKRPARTSKHAGPEHDDNGQTDVDSRTATFIGPRVKTKRIVVDGAAPDADITPLRFLQRVMQDSKAPAKLRIKIAAKITPYVHYQPAGRPGEAEQIADSGHARAVVIKDQFGYDPEFLKEMMIDEILFDWEQTKRVATGKVSPEEAKVLARIKRRRPLLRRSEDYTHDDFFKDEARLRQLIAKEKSKQANSKLTAEEKAESLHLRARIHIFFNGGRLVDPGNLADPDLPLSFSSTRS